MPHHGSARRYQRQRRAGEHMSWRAALAVVPDVERAEGELVEALAPDLQAVRDATRAWKIATVEVARAFLAAHQNGRTTREIAEAAEVSQSAVTRALRAFKIALESTGLRDEVDQKALDAAMHEVRQPQPATPKTGADGKKRAATKPVKPAGQSDYAEVITAAGANGTWKITEKERQRGCRDVC